MVASRLLQILTLLKLLEFSLFQVHRRNTCRKLLKRSVVQKTYLSFDLSLQ